MNKIKQFSSVILLGLIASCAQPVYAQIVNPGSPAQAGTGLAQSGSTLSVKYGSTAGTALQGNAVATVVQGGTGLATLPAGQLLTGNGTGNVSAITNGTAGYGLISNGTGSTPPSFQVLPSALVSSVFNQVGAIPNLSGDATTTGSSAVTLANTGTARTDLGLGTANSVTFGGLQNTPVGNTTANTGAFTTLSASGAVSGPGFSTYLASPPAIGSTAAGSGAFTTLSASGAVSGSGFSTYLASPPAIGGTTAAAGNFTALASSGVLTAGGAVNFAAPVSLASAASVAIGGAASNNVTITGTTTITSFDTVAAGIIRVVTFSGTLTLTNNNTSLILPASLKIITQAGDIAIFQSLGSGNWKCISYNVELAGFINHGEAFDAYYNSTLAVSNNTWTKIPFNTLNFDTNGYFDAVTNYRFTPLTPGYYQINASDTCTAGYIGYCGLAIYKNGSVYSESEMVSNMSSANILSQMSASLSNVIYFNGSTDYVEVYGLVAYSTGGNTPELVGGTYSKFSGALIRSN